MDVILGWALAILIFLTTFVTFASSLIAATGFSDWRARGMAWGSGFLFLMATLLLIALILINLGKAPTEVLALIVPSLFLFPIGIIFFLVGAFSFCARFGAKGIRLGELRELTSAIHSRQMQAEQTSGMVLAQLEEREGQE